MKDRITKALAKCFCPNEFELNIKCEKPCPVQKMQSCWNTAFEKYNLKVSSDCDLRYLMFGYSFQFEIMEGKNEL